LLNSPFREELNKHHTSTSTINIMITFPLHSEVEALTDGLCRRVQSPYTLSLYQQVILCIRRGFQRLKGDASVTISRVVGNTALALVVGMKEILQIPRTQVSNYNYRVGIL
jgi:hypothetical protein